MTIADSLRAGKAQLGRAAALAGRVPRDVLVVAIVALASSASFGLGYLTGAGNGAGSDFKLEESPLTAAVAAADPHPSEAELSATAAPKTGTPAPAALPAGGQYVASKNGTKFYLPWCGGVKAIKDANKVWFASKADALAAGYSPAANCKGI